MKSVKIIRTMEGQHHELWALPKNTSPPRNVLILHFKKKNSQSFPHLRNTIQEQQESLKLYFRQPRRFLYVLMSDWSRLVFSIRQRKKPGWGTEWVYASAKAVLVGHPYISVFTYSALKSCCLHWKQFALSKKDWHFPWM